MRLHCFQFHHKFGNRHECRYINPFILIFFIKQSNMLLYIRTCGFTVDFKCAHRASGQLHDNEHELWERCKLSTVPERLYIAGLYIIKQVIFLYYTTNI